MEERPLKAKAQIFGQAVVNFPKPDITGKTSLVFSGTDKRPGHTKSPGMEPKNHLKDSSL